MLDLPGTLSRRSGTGELHQAGGSRSPDGLDAALSAGEQAVAMSRNLLNA
jgi:hypothetical protein